MSAAASLATDARDFFSEDALPPSLEWVSSLSPRHLRLFAVELNAALAAREPDPYALEELIDSWKATAEMDSSPELRATIEGNRKGRFESADEWLKARSTA